eukprot:CAMPEP_0205915216 /NCGR_PEP_ID=MMETSP1325-20131115/7725_1 /ASSEMBLY_ACC=CAM_ASM_000708 /TAXON_ID=236786 /ORGANISM="Florenciella sp., Strain RCC1007" /LENGTH=46 /DNA_ID= /DNA_START= /DNA_END= /DNA_ORIENTATION=
MKMSLHRCGRLCGAVFLLSPSLGGGGWPTHTSKRLRALSTTQPSSG